MNNSTSFKKRLALNIFSEYKKIEAKIHDLQYLFWECTARCNLNCIHCGSDCSIDSSIPDMKIEDFLKVTSEIKNQYDSTKIMIVLTGGEPLIRSDLEQLGKELKKQNYSWGIVTNGVLLSNDKLNKLIDAGLSSVSISLDGMEKNHNWLRNSNCYEYVINSIKLLVNRTAVKLDVVSCISPKNINELSEMKSLLISLGVKKWRLFTISPIGRAKQNKNFQLDNQQYRQLLEFIRKSRFEKEIQVNYECEGFLGKYEMEVRDNLFFCRAGISIASILADGSVSACPNIDNRFSQGNIFKDNFLDLWNDEFVHMRNREWMKNGVCSECKVFKFCLGNGFHLRDFDSKNVNVCHYNKIYD